MKPFLLISLLLSPALLWAQSNVYKIEGNVAKVKPGAKAYLLYILGKTVYSDSALINNGRFFITGIVDQPYYARILIESEFVRFYLEPGTISVSSPDSIQNAIVGGSPMNIDNQQLKKMLIPTDDQYP